MLFTNIKITDFPSTFDCVAAEPPYTVSGPGQPFNVPPVNDETYYVSRVINGCLTTYYYVEFSSCSATEVYSSWDWARIPDSVWTRTTEYPELVDTLEITDDKPPLPNPPEWHILPEIGFDNSPLAYGVYAWVKLVDDVPFVGEVEYKLCWDDLALSWLLPDEIPQWQTAREFSKSYDSANGIQNDIWNKNLAAWRLSVIARDSRGNETLPSEAVFLKFADNFDTGMTIGVRLVNPDALETDPDYGLKEIVFDAHWEGDTGFASLGAVPVWGEGVEYTANEYVRDGEGRYWRCRENHLSILDDQPPSSKWSWVGESEKDILDDWEKAYDWDFKFECDNPIESLSWISETSGVRDSRSYTYIYKTNLTDEQLEQELGKSLSFRPHIRYRIKAEEGEPLNDWAFEFIGGWCELE